MGALALDCKARGAHEIYFLELTAKLLLLISPAPSSALSYPAGFPESVAALR